MNLRQTIYSHLDEIRHSTYVVVNLPTGALPCEGSTPRFMTNNIDKKCSVFCVGYFKDIRELLFDERVPKYSHCLYTKHRIDDSVEISVM